MHSLTQQLRGNQGNLFGRQYSVPKKDNSIQRSPLHAKPERFFSESGFRDMRIHTYAGCRLFTLWLGSFRNVALPRLCRPMEVTRAQNDPCPGHRTSKSRHQKYNREGLVQPMAAHRNNSGWPEDTFLSSVRTPDYGHRTTDKRP